MGLGRFDKCREVPLGVNHLPAGREVGALDRIVGDQLIVFDLGIFEQLQERVADFFQVVGRDVGGHADRDSGGSVDQQVGDSAGKNDRFLVAAVIVVLERDGARG